MHNYLNEKQNTASSACLFRKQHIFGTPEKQKTIATYVA